MKAISLFCGFLFTTTSLFSQIPNSGFENWVSNNAGGERPQGWNTLDSINFTLSQSITNSASKSTDSYSGTYALKLTSFLGAFSLKSPGAASNGIAVFANGSPKFIGGSPWTTRSRFLKGRFKYLPASPNDKGVITVGLFRYNTSTVPPSRDTIAFGSDTISGPVNSYTPFSVILAFSSQYFSVNPDSCLIVFQSSKFLQDPDLAIGSELYVDDVYFDGVVGVDETSSKLIPSLLYPLPADQKLTVEVEKKILVGPLKINILDMTGKQVLASTLSAERMSIDVSGLIEGNYLFQLMNQQGESISVERFSIVH